MPEVRNAKIGPIRRWAQERPFLFLTVALLVIMMCMPLATTKLSRLIFVELNFLMVLGVAVSATGNRRIYVKWALYLWIISASLDVIAYFWDMPRFREWLQLVNELSSLTFLLGATAFLLRFILRAERVNTNSVFAATSSYILLALVWAYAYSLTDLFDPQAFSGINHAAGSSRVDLVYFSVVTITTLGYGDISPLSPFARMLAAVESLVGQLYLAVLVAWLVGLTISNRQMKKRGG